MNRGSEPLVSVIIPTFDRDNYLVRAVESVLNQSYGNIELVVVDDYSPRPAEEVLDGVSLDRVSDYRLIRHEENRGGSAARNTGINAASGDYVAFLDDDDEWLPEKLDKQVARMEESGASVGVVYTGIRNVDAEGKTNAVKTPGIEGDVTKKLLCKNFIGSFSAIMVSQEVIEEVGGLDERFPSWQDWDYYIRLSQHSRFASVPEPLVIRYNHRDGQVSEGFTEKRDVTYRLFVEKYESLAAEQGTFFKRKMRSYVAYELALSALFNQQYDAAKDLLEEAVKWYPLNTGAYVYWVLSLRGGAVHDSAKRIKRSYVRRVE